MDSPGRRLRDGTRLMLDRLTSAESTSQGPAALVG